MKKISSIKCILLAGLASFNASATTEQEFLDTVPFEFKSPVLADGTYNFNQKTRMRVVNSDGTIEYPLLNSGILEPNPITPSNIQFLTSSSEPVGARSATMSIAPAPTASQQGSTQIANQLYNTTLTNEPSTPIDITTRKLNTAYHPLQNQMVKGSNGLEFSRVSDTDELVVSSGYRVVEYKNQSLTYLSQQTLASPAYANGQSTLDINSDGIEEIVQVSYTAKSGTILQANKYIDIIERGKPIKRYAAPNIDFYNPKWETPLANVKVIGGDFNGDNIKDELLVAHNGTIELYRYTGGTWVLESSHMPWEGQTSWNVSVDAKDIDNKPGLEVIVTYNTAFTFTRGSEGEARVELYKYTKNAQNQYSQQYIIGSATAPDPAFRIDSNIVATDIALAQLVPGGNFEVVVAGGPKNSLDLRTNIIETASIDLTNGKLIDYVNTSWLGNNNMPDYMPNVATWNNDGAGDLILFNGREYRRHYDTTSSNYILTNVYNEPDAGAGYIYKYAIANILESTNSTTNYPDKVVMVINTSDGRLKNDSISYQGSDPSVNFANRISGTIYTPNYTPVPFPFITMQGVNFVNDERLAIYEGHQLRFSEPQIYSILAASPFYSEQTNPDDVYTSLTLDNGTTNSSSTASGSGFNVEAGFNVSTKVGAVAKVSVEVEARFFTEGESTTQWLKDITTATSLTFSAKNGEDKLLLSVIPVDHYMYSVVSSNPQIAATENVQATGFADFVIDVPRMPLMTQTTVAAMQQQSLKNDYIDPAFISRTLSHTIGVPSSYMSKAQAQAQINSLPADSIIYRYNSNGNLLSTLQGTGSSHITEAIALTTDLGTDYSYTQSVGGSVALTVGGGVEIPGLYETEITGTIGGGGWGVTANSWGTTLSSGVTVSGDVADLSLDDVCNGLENFSFGVIGLPLDLQQISNSPFINQPVLVTYWTEGATNTALQKPGTAGCL